MSGNAGMSTLTNGMLRKEKAFRDEIEWNHETSVGLATRLKHGGTMEGLLGEEAVQKFRENLKRLAEDNVGKGRQLRAYMNAVRNLGNDVAPASAAAGDDDVQAKLERAVQEEREKIDKDSIEATKESQYLELCKEIGEDQGDDDDEIAVVQGELDEHVLKCPFTAALMEDPVKNKVCKHSYSRAAIMRHIQSSGGRKCVCPVAACHNKQVTASQLEDDKRTEMLVRRFKKRRQLSQKSQSAVDVDDEEDDE